MSRKRITWTAIIIVAILLLAIPKLIPKQDGKPLSGARPGGPQPHVKVTVYVVKKQDLKNTIQSVGNIMAEEEVELRSETQGRVVKINFREGDEVKKGQVLVKINDADLQAQLNKAVAAKKLKEETEQRNRQLLAKGGISQETYDMSATDLSGAIADIDLLKEQIRRTEVIAPFDGLIGLRSISEGGYLNNTNIIARLQDTKRVKIEFSVPEKYSSMIRDGNEIVFRVEGQNRDFYAKIYAIEPKIDPVSRNIIVRAICDNSDRKLLPGAFAKVNVTLQNNPDALLIPTQSVVPILKGQKVFLVKGDSVIERNIEIGTRTDVNVEVTKGVQEGDSIVVQGVIQMRPGARVRVIH
jgi:membrane fusion protein (multidrug efflux system)